MPNRCWSIGILDVWSSAKGNFSAFHGYGFIVFDLEKELDHVVSHISFRMIREVPEDLKLFPLT
jgi:hypothetical protein